MFSVWLKYLVQAATPTEVDLGRVQTDCVVGHMLRLVFRYHASSGQHLGC
jgi:hypothetical protein